MNLKELLQLLERANRQTSPYGYDNTDNILVGVLIDDRVYNISELELVRGGIIIKPQFERKEQVAKLLEPKNKNKKENDDDKVERSGD